MATYRILSKGYLFDQKSNGIFKGQLAKINAKGDIFPVCLPYQLTKGDAFLRYFKSVVPIE